MNNHGARFLRIVGLILGANLLLPVSCVLGSALSAQTIVGPQVRDIDAGEAPHETFRIVTRDEDGRLKITALRERTGTGPLKLDSTTGTVEAGECCTASYRVINNTGATQTIELEYTDRRGGNITTSITRYATGPDGVRPIQSRVRNIRAMSMAALPWGIAIAFSIWLCGRLLRWRFPAANENKDKETEP